MKLIGAVLVALASADQLTRLTTNLATKWREVETMKQVKTKIRRQKQGKVLTLTEISPNDMPNCWIATFNFWCLNLYFLGYDHR